MLVFVRHGRTAANAQGRLQGRLDLPLDELGEQQATLIAAVLPAPARVISSPLLRARQTADALGLPVEVDERFVELDYGELDGRPIADVGVEVWERWHHDLHYQPGGGESLAAVFDRVVPACEELLDEARDRDIVIVSHVSPIKAALTWALGVTSEVGWRTHLDHASITRVGGSSARPVLRSFNETQHLHAAQSQELRITG